MMKKMMIRIMMQMSMIKAETKILRAMQRKTKIRNHHLKLLLVSSKLILTQKLERKQKIQSKKEKSTKKSKRNCDLVMSFELPGH